MEPGIYLELAPARSSGSGLFDYKHAYLVYRKKDGRTEVLRGGPDLRLDSFVSNGGLTIRVEVGKSLEESEDKYGDEERPGSRPSHRLSVSMEKADALWRNMRAKVEEIGQAGLSYSPLFPGVGGSEKTSNSVIRAALDAADIPFQSALPQGYKVDRLPGFEDNLKNALEQRRRAKERNEDLPETDVMSDAASPGRLGDDDREALIADLTRSDDPVDEILLKQPDDLTEGEARDLAARRLASGDAAERQALFGFEKVHYDDLYGAGPAARDATGRLIQPVAAKAQNQTPVTARGIDGRPVAETVAAVADQVAGLVRSGGRRDAVRALQRGLNILIREPWRTPDYNPEVWRNRLRRNEAEGPYARFAGQQILKDDGDPGPKTRSVLRRAAAAWGRPRVEEALALGKFEDAARAADRLPAGGVRSAAETAFGSLFPARAALPGGSRPEGFGLQMAINDLGRDAMVGTFHPLVEDGIIGPKTEAAFHEVLKAAGPDRFVGTLGRGMGFFGGAEDVAEIA